MCEECEDPSAPLVPLPPPAEEPTDALVPSAAPPLDFVAFTPHQFPIVAECELTEQDKLVIGQLVRKEAFDLRRACGLDAPQKSLHYLRERGIIVPSALEGVDNAYRLNLDCVKLERCPKAKDPVALGSQQLTRFRFDQASKLLIIQHLVLRGFKGKPVNAVWFEKISHRSFAPRMFSNA